MLLLTAIGNYTLFICIVAKNTTLRVSQYIGIDNNRDIKNHNYQYRVNTKHTIILQIIQHQLNILA